MTDRAPCPCGEVPEKLCISDPNGRWAYVSGYCCGEWRVEFRADYMTIGDTELEARAEKAWTAAPRPAKRTCEWTEDEDGNWFAACGTAWSFSDGGPAENNVRYCHSCGAEVVAKPYEGVTFP